MSSAPLVFNVQNRDGSKIFTVLAHSYEELCSKAKASGKLDIRGPVFIVLRADGAAIDEESYHKFDVNSTFPHLVVLPKPTNGPLPDARDLNINLPNELNGSKRGNIDEEACGNYKKIEGLMGYRIYNHNGSIRVTIAVACWEDFVTQACAKLDITSEVMITLTDSDVAVDALTYDLFPGAAFTVVPRSPDLSMTESKFLYLNLTNELNQDSKGSIDEKAFETLLEVSEVVARSAAVYALKCTRYHEDDPSFLNSLLDHIHINSVQLSAFVANNVDHDVMTSKWHSLVKDFLTQFSSNTDFCQVLRVMIHLTVMVCLTSQTYSVWLTGPAAQSIWILLCKTHNISVKENSEQAKDIYAMFCEFIKEAFLSPSSEFCLDLAITFCIHQWPNPQLAVCLSSNWKPWSMDFEAIKAVAIGGALTVAGGLLAIANCIGNP